MRTIAGFMLALMLLVPAFAHAWTLQASVIQPSGSGNSIAVNGTPILTGTSYVSVATNASVAFTPAAGYVVSKVVLNGATQSAPANPFTVTNTGSSQSLIVYFAAQTYAVSATQASGGKVTIQQTAPTLSGSSQTSLSGIKSGATFKVTAQPASDYKVTSIIVDGVSSAKTSGAGVGQSQSFAVTKSQIVSATFALVPNYSIVMKAPSLVTIGTPVTLSASGTTSNDATVDNSGTSATNPNYGKKTLGLSFAYQVTGCNAVPASRVATLDVPTFEFTPGAGTCVATVTVTSAHSATGFTAPNYKSVSITTQTLATAANGSCITCHSQNSSAVITAYNASAHATTNTINCQTCHTATPHSALPTATTCESCHAGTLSKTTHPVAITASKCLSCHDSHDPAAGIANLTPSNHPAVTLYTFEEVGMQMAGGAKVPVQVDANGKGMPYSPKQTCGTSGCHVKNGIDYTYDKISDHAFHSGQGRSEYQDSSDGKFSALKNKPWLQSTAMVGKW